MTMRALKKQKIKPTNTERDKRVEPCIILQLPDHILLEIFYRIPTNTLIQCKYVCKSWRRSLSDPEFTKTLFKRTPTCLFLRYSTRSRRLSVDYVPPDKHILANLESVSSPNNMVLKLSDPNALYNKPTTSQSGVMGSCNGFLCLYRYSRRIGSFIFHISNPITSECMPVPVNTAIGIPEGCGFGYSPISDVYKVVVFTTNRLHSRRRELSPEFEICRDLYVMVLTVGSGVWRRIGKVSNTIYPIHGVFHNGFLHWVFERKEDPRSLFIRAFDVENERFKDFAMPPHDFFPSVPLLRVIGGSLSTSDNRDGLTCWVMKEYGVKKSWTKELEIGRDTIGSIRYAKVLKFMEEKVLLLGDEKLWVYTPKTRTLVSVEVDGMPSDDIRFEADCHTPSFVPLKAIMSTN